MAAEWEEPLLHISACGAGGAGDHQQTLRALLCKPCCGRGRCFASARAGQAVRESLATPAESTTNLTLQTLLREGPLLRISACGACGVGELDDTTSRHYKPYFRNLAVGGAAASHQCVWGRRCGRAREQQQERVQTLLWRGSA